MEVLYIICYLHAIISYNMVGMDNDLHEGMPEGKEFMTKKIIIIALSGAFLAVTVFFVFSYFTQFGATVSYQFNSMMDRDKLSKIDGAQEASTFNPSQQGILQIPQQVIRQDIVTFNLKLITKPIEGVWVNLKFKGNPKEIKLGVRGSEKENYQYLPLYNRILDSLTWHQTENGDVVFSQRE